MKLLLLKILLQRRARDEGFTLPMVIALGLVMILLGAVSITIANEENITAISQNSRSDALAIAELGVARYRELLDRNRILAVNDSSQWATETQVCNNNVNEPGNAQDDKVPSLVPNVANPIALLEDGQVLNNDGDSSDNFNIGSYSLVSYDYTNANNSSVNGVFNLTNDTANNDSIGRLKVQGTAPDGSEAQIEAEIPIRINLDRKINSTDRTNGDMTNLAPALWIGNTSPTLGNLTIGNGNVVIKDSAVITGTTRDGCRNFSDTDTTDGSQNLASTVTFPVATPQGTVISDSRNLPPITKIINRNPTNLNRIDVTKPDGDVEKARTALSLGNTDTINTIPTTPGTALFGATSDRPYNPDSNTSNCPNIKLCRYYYAPPETTGLTYTNTNLLSDGIARTTLVLFQPLSISATSQDVRVGSTGTISDSDAFEIYVNGSTNAITINADSGRTVTINGFIHAPDSTLTITGTGTVNINGSVWVNNFVNSTATVNISPDTITRLPTPDNDKTSGKGYEFYSTAASRTPRPITGSPTNWKTEQVN